MPSSRSAARLIPAALIAAVLLAGCSTLKGSKRLDVGPFSENTLGMIGELQKYNRSVVWTHLRKYQTLASVKQTQETNALLRRLLRGVGLYSGQVVSLYEAPIPEDRKIRELARYMDEYIRPNLTVDDTPEDFKVTPGYMDSLTRNIRESETLLAALGAAQPLVGAAVSVGNVILDRLDGNVRVAADEINSLIQMEFASMNARLVDLESMHVNSVRSYTLIQRHVGGDATALDTLRSYDPGVREYMPIGRAPTSKEVDAAERYVLERTATLKSLRDQLEPDFTRYRECLDELEMLRNQTDERARLARMTLTLWGRSHRNLANGISVPPMIDVMGIMKSTVSTGVKGVLP